MTVVSYPPQRQCQYQSKIHNQLWIFLLSNLWTSYQNMFLIVCDIRWNWCDIIWQHDAGSRFINQDLTITFFQPKIFVGDSTRRTVEGLHLFNHQPTVCVRHTVCVWGAENEKGLELQLPPASDPKVVAFSMEIQCFVNNEFTPFLHSEEKQSTPINCTSNH